MNIQLFGDNNDKKPTVNIKNTQFVNSVFEDYDKKNLLLLINANLILEGIVKFCAITNHNSIIDLNNNSTITVKGIVELSNNIGQQLISFNSNNNQYIKMKEPSIIIIINNQVCNYFAIILCEKILHPFCMFQYFSNRTLKHANFSVMYNNNQYHSIVTQQRCYRCDLPVINCHWLPQSSFHHMIPTDINDQFIKYSNILMH